MYRTVQKYFHLKTLYRTEKKAFSQRTLKLFTVLPMSLLSFLRDCSAVEACVLACYFLQFVQKSQWCGKWQLKKKSRHIGYTVS